MAKKWLSVASSPVLTVASPNVMVLLAIVTIEDHNGAQVEILVFNQVYSLVAPQIVEDNIILARSRCACVMNAPASSAMTFVCPN